MGEMGVSFGVLLLERWDRRLRMQGMSKLEVLGPQIPVQRLWVFMVWVPVMWVLCPGDDAVTSDVGAAQSR